MATVTVAFSVSFYPYRPTRCDMAFIQFSRSASHGHRNERWTLSYFQGHGAEVLRDLDEGAGPLVIMQNGEAKAVASYAATWKLLAFLKLLAMAQDDLVAGRVQPLEGLKKRIRERAAR